MEAFCDALYLSSLLTLESHLQSTSMSWDDTEASILYIGDEAQVLKWQLLKIDQFFLPDFSELLASFRAEPVQIGFYFTLTPVGAVDD